MFAVGGISLSTESRPQAHGMSTTPRVTPPPNAKTADFGTLMSYIGKPTAAFFDLYAQYWQRGVLPADLKEITRLRNARVTDCGY